MMDLDRELVALEAAEQILRLAEAAGHVDPVIDALEWQPSMWESISFHVGADLDPDTRALAIQIATHTLNPRPPARLTAPGRWWFAATVTVGALILAAALIGVLAYIAGTLNT